jgi:hypothetical protein
MGQLLWMKSIKYHILVIQATKKLLLQQGSNTFGLELKGVFLNNSKMLEMSVDQGWELTPRRFVVTFSTSQMEMQSNND